MPKVIPKSQFNGLDVRRFDGYNSRDTDINVGDFELTGGRDMDRTADKALEKRQGHSLYGNFIGPTTGILGLINHSPAGGTAEKLAVYDTGVYRDVSGTWTLLTGGATLTTNLKVTSVHFPITGKTYISNGTDNVQIYTSGSTISSDASHKKANVFLHFKNRILAAIGKRIWYTDLGVDTYGSSNYLDAPDTVTGMVEVNNRWLTFTKKEVRYTQNFTFSGTAVGPEQFLPLPGNFGAIYERTIAKVGNLVYFMGQSADGVAAIYVTDGQTIGNTPISDKISPDFGSLAPAQLTNACAVAYGKYYRISVTPSGQTTNTLEYLYDTVERMWLVPWRNNLGGFSCYMTYETSGQLDIYGGSQSVGEVYKLNQVDYDEKREESFSTIGAQDIAVDANPAKRGGQSFKLTGYNSTRSVTVNSVWVRLKKNTGTTTDLQVRIETDNNGKPSGTLADADATATITAFSSTTYAYYKAAFSNVTLTGNTTYWIVVKHATEGSGTSQYYWSGHASGGYAYGNEATYASGVTTASDTYNPGATAVAGDAFYTNGSDQTFSTVRAGSGVVGETSNTINMYLLAGSTTDKWRTMSRGILQFDTSPLPNDAVITSATIQLYCEYKLDNHSQSIGITSVTPASATSIVSSDYAVANYGSTRFATDVTTASLTTNAYNTWTLNASGRAAIDVTGISKFAIRYSADIDSTAPTWTSAFDNITTTFTNYTGTYVPRLVVNYTTVTGVFSWTSDTGKDANFLLYAQSDIDGYADSKAFFLAPQGQQYHLPELFVTADASGSYPIQVGVSNGTYAAFTSQDMSLSANAPVIGSDFTIGSSTLGSLDRAEERLRFSGMRGRTAKFRFRNQRANQPFRIYGYRTRHEIIPKLK